MSSSYYFSPHELACRCGRPPGVGPDHCDAPPMSPAFLHKLDTLRELWGRPLIVSSGARCRWHNAHVGGAADSRHVHGDAADLLVSSTMEAIALSQKAGQVGMGGIGIAAGFVHVDDGPAGRRWTYPSRSR